MYGKLVFVSSVCLFLIEEEYYHLIMRLIMNYLFYHYIYSIIFGIHKYIITSASY